MPKMGESITEATVLSWLKNVGDTIEQDESVVEVATDKVDTEVPATHGGVLKEILAQVGDVVEVGKTIAIISTESDEEVNGAVSTGLPVEKVADIARERTPAVMEEALHTGNGLVKMDKSTAGRFLSPLVLNIARQESIPMMELETLPGTGKEGRITKKDILSYVKTRKTGTQVAASPVLAPTRTSTPAPTPTPTPVPVSISGTDEIIEMDRMRRMIAERMVESKRISAHVTSFVEADLTNIVNWRNKVKKEFEKREGEKLTYTPIIIEALVKAIKDYPMINVSVDGTNIIRHREINIGLAVALPTGNLIVPVIRNADQLSLTGLTKKVNDLASRARENKLVPDDLFGGTFTISNVGSFGNVMGTPVIVQPQVAIMAVGAIVKKPAVIETPTGDAIGIRHKMFLSHSYDHRVVDGALGGMVVRKVADYLEAFDPNRTL